MENKKYTRMSLNFRKPAKPDFLKFITPASPYRTRLLCKKSENYSGSGIIDSKDVHHLTTGREGRTLFMDRESNVLGSAPVDIDESFDVVTRLNKKI